jgi:hypothetical protein
MTRITIVIAAGLPLAVTLPSVSAQAQNGTLTRSFVSSTGLDTNSCTITQPCATFTRAYTAIGANGIIAALDPGKYGSLTISGPVTINGNGWAAITALPQNNGITINAGSGKVILTGLEIDGAGTGYNGIVFNTGSSLTVSNCILQNFLNSTANDNNFITGIGVLMQPSSGTFRFAITNTTASNNGYAGINYQPQGGSPVATGVIDHVVTINNEQGIVIDTNATDSGSTTVAISNSVASENSVYGIAILDNGLGTDASPNLLALIDNNEINGNGTGIPGSITSKILLGRSAITGNGTGIVNTNSGFFFTYKDNRINGNGTDISGPTLTTDGLQ